MSYAISDPQAVKSQIYMYNVVQEFESHTKYYLYRKISNKIYKIKSANCDK